MHLLILNVGSSSIKFAIFNDTELVHEENRQKIFSEDQRKDTLKEICGILEEKGIKVDAIGHRVVHGGDFSDSCELTSDKIELLRKYCQLAPLHNTPALQVIEAAQNVFDGIPQYGVFDTSFYADMPKVARVYPIPYKYYEKGVKRYGFHGTSHRYVSSKGEGRVVTCHLGNGGSVTAVKDGHAMDTSMGFTPLEGLVMGTRSGDLDPAIIQYIAKEENKSMDEVFEMLQKESGLLGISQESNDCYDLECSDSDGAALAIDVYSYRLLKYVGAYIAVLNGLDTLIFTAGIGEKSPIIRGKVCRNLEFLGLKIDEEANGKNAPVISTPDSKVKVMVVPTKEDLMIVQDVIDLHTAKK
jgi:acetate kinase